MTTSSSTLSFVFCHGWGFNPKFWQPLQACFQDANCHVIDLGYENSQKSVVSPLLSPHITYVGVGHSLGLIKLLKLPLKFRALVGLQSFVHFLGFDPNLRLKRYRAWNFMYQNFQAHSQATLHQFYQTCFMSMPDSHRVNLQLLSPKFDILNQDLLELSEPYCLPHDIPSLILGTTHDKIVPPALIYDNFASVKNVHLEVYPTEGHCLGFDHSIMVAEKIRDFVNTHA